MDFDDPVIGQNSVGGPPAERPPELTDAEAIAQTTAFLRERGIDDPERTATDLVKNLRVYGVAERRDPQPAEVLRKRVAEAMARCRHGLAAYELYATDYALADAALDALRGERRDPLEPATEIKMLALVNELLTWAFDQATLDKEAFQRAAEILLDDLLYLAGFREPSALRAGGPAREEASDDEETNMSGLTPEIAATGQGATLIVDGKIVRVVRGGVEETLCDEIELRDRIIEHLSWCRHCGEGSPAECDIGGADYRSWRALSSGLPAPEEMK